MTTITITDINQLRAGDVATCSYRGHEFTGEVWAASDDGSVLFAGAACVRVNDGRPSPYVTLISATRDVPDLPTEPGSVIANVVTRYGLHYDWATLARMANRSGLMWIVSSANWYRWASPDEIISWDPCTVEVQSCNPENPNRKD